MTRPHRAPRALPLYATVLRLVLASVAIASAAGCFGGASETAPADPALMKPSTKLASPEEQARLYAELTEFEKEYESQVQGAVSALKRRASDPAMRNAATQWQIALIGRGKEFLKNPSPVAGLLDFWGLCVSVKQYLQTGAGAHLFGEHQKIALDPAIDLEEQIAELAESFFTEAEHKELAAAVSAYAASHPMSGVFDVQRSATFTMASDGLSAIQSGFGMVLSPITAVGSSVVAVADLPGSVSRIADILEDYPRELFLQLELTAGSLLGEKGVMTVVESIERTSLSLEKVAGAIDRMPQDVQAIVRTTLEESVASLPELRATIEQANATLLTVDAIAAKTTATTVEAANLVAKIDLLARSLESLVGAVGVFLDRWPPPDPALPPPDPALPPPPPPEPGPPFDITKYTETVVALTGTVEQLRGSLVEMRGLVESHGIPGSLQSLNTEVIETSAQSAGNLVDLVAWRAGQLLVLFFALLIAALVANRFLRRRSAPPAE